MSKVLKRLYLGDVVKSFGTKQLRKLTTEEPVYELCGVWTIKEAPTYAPTSANPLYFTTSVAIECVSGHKHSSFRYLSVATTKYKEDVVNWRIVYGCECVSSENLLNCDVYRFDITANSGEWLHESAIRTIDFGKTPQQANKEFYEWFTSIARKQ